MHAPLRTRPAACLACLSFCESSPSLTSLPFAIRYDDEDGHYLTRMGELFAGRYRAVIKIGEGTFGKVLACDDTRGGGGGGGGSGRQIAVKVIRNVAKYRDAAMVELDILRDMADNDPERTSRCIR